MDEICYAKKIKCPVCGSTFEATKLKASKLRAVKKDTDMFRYYNGENPYFYEINVCPKCGFAFSDNFKENLNEFHIERFKKLITSHWEMKNYGGKRDVEKGLETYKLALLSAQVMELKSSIIAGILLHICWLNRLMNNSEEEQRFMKGAIESYKKAFEVEDLEGGKSISPEIVIYLLGELNYRIGNFAESAKWFNLAISKYGNNPAVKKQTINMIRDRWMDIREEMKSKGVSQK